MANDIGNYARHAKYWDWGGYDRSEEHEYWRKYASKYGKNVLIPMCAWGETGAYMARRGMSVTAFDITPEMVAEGKKRFGGVPGLWLCEGDVRDFRFDIEPADFCFCMDFGHILAIEDVKKALVCINNHLRGGGCLVIETGLRVPGEKSDYHPLKTFQPLKQIYPGIKVWKTGDTRNDAETGRCYISQTFYAEYDNGNTESFGHAFYLQGYYREEWLASFKECGFDVTGEYSSREVESWQSGGDKFRIFEVVKSMEAKKRYSPALSFDYLQTPICRHENAALHNDGTKLQHIKIDLDTDISYILECHCRINYECETPWARKIPYEQYRANWFAWPGQQDGFLSALRDSMGDERTIVEIIKSEEGDTVGYLWAQFHGEDERFIWADVQDIYIEETYRKSGIAFYLMDYAEQAARRNGAKVIRSGTGCENIKSQGLHQKLGYYQYRMEYEKML